MQGRRPHPHQLPLCSIVAPAAPKAKCNLGRDAGYEARQTLRQLVADDIKLEPFGAQMRIREYPMQLHRLILDAVNIERVFGETVDWLDLVAGEDKCASSIEAWDDEGLVGLRVLKFFARFSSGERK